MSTHDQRSAAHPEDLAHFFVTRANAGDVEGLVALYDADAVLVDRQGKTLRGTDAIRRYYSEFLARRPVLYPVIQRPAIRRDGMALTSSRLVNGVVTAEVAQQRPDGTWVWIIDHPAIARETP